MTQHYRSIRAAARIALLLLAAALGASVQAAPDPCAGMPQCQNLGPFTATVTKVNVTRQDSVTAYQGVKTTVRFTNIGRQPLVLGYRDKTSAVTDDKGLAYRWSSKATGIGLVSRGVADPQFQLASGESREASFEGVLQYSMRRQVAGNVFQHDFTIVELAQVGPRQIRELRDHAVSFSQLSATSGFAGGGARPAGGVAVAMPATAPAPAGPVAQAPAPPQAREGCAGAVTCQVQGPLQASVVRVNVTDSGGVTAYHTVRTTVRFQNLGAQPLFIGYRNKSGAVSDNKGLAYRWGSKAYGIGLVDANVADPQFRLAPGESREAAFESTLQYGARHTTPGNVFQHDLTIALLQVVGPNQVRATSDLAFSFSNLSAGGGTGGAGLAGDASVQTINKVVDLFKSLKKP
jgi:hypothetical protein